MPPIAGLDRRITGGKTIYFAAKAMQEQRSRGPQKEVSYGR
jgi:hypothetical protein